MSTVPRLVVARLGDTTPELTQQQGPFEAWILREMGRTPHDAQVLCPYKEDSPLPAPEACRAVVLSGSGAMVTENTPWMRRCKTWVQTLIAAEVPLLGICFGHQLLASALGGRIAANPRGPEVGTVELSLTEAAKTDPLFCDFPVKAYVQTSHIQSVLQLPPEAVCLATTPRDPHHVFRAGTLAWGVQFHPEFNVQAMQTYIDRHSARLNADGQNVRELQRGATETGDAARLLERFDRLVMERTYAAV